ncbi:MAG: DUF3592 domain-containing protein [Anaerolineae bacterium]|nr:DUF3592 domain-containing protein [Anaerolineae bacterium]
MDSRLIFLILCISIGVILIALLPWLIHEEIIHRKLLKEGIRTKGKITAMRRELYKYGKSARCLVAYRFRVQEESNKPYTVEQEVMEGRYNLLSVGSEVDVIYLPSNPRTAQLLFD